MTRAVFRMVLLVSCAHALVHVLELALPSVEQLLVPDYRIDKETVGWLAVCWRLPFGLGALAAGWLVDRFGSRPMLAFYLAGAAGCCAVVALQPPLPGLFAAMLAMGTFSCVYHPAGLTLISHRAPREILPRALGMHGVFGSIGIGLAPLSAALLLDVGLSWQAYYWLLAAPAALLMLLFAIPARVKDSQAVPAAGQAAPQPPADGRANWPAFLLLTVAAAMQGFIYWGVLVFLPRYLGEWHPAWLSQGNESFERYLAGGVLLAGCAGQYLAGRFARGHALERQIMWIMLGNAPFLFWMAAASGPYRAVAALLWALVHFMHQPIYNSLIARYTPARRRSLCYGFSFLMGFGVGSFGAAFAGRFEGADVYLIYASLGGLALASAGVGLALTWLAQGAEKPVVKYG